mmetsp:Transcript_3602/g.9012  ORF Transcript_3602/g.9012 Transcript_3602/m.9012 type:complete len:323 (+) Transcript_3602:191-1159(+)
MLLSTIEVGKERPVGGSKKQPRERKPVLFMLAGFPDDHSVWTKLAAEFKTTFRVVVACLPDYDKRKPAKTAGHNLDEVLGAIIETVNAVTSADEKVTLVLHGWGCFFGYHYAGTRPEKVEAVVAFDSGLFPTRSKTSPKPKQKGKQTLTLKFSTGNLKNTAKRMLYQWVFAACFVLGNVLGTAMVSRAVIYPLWKFGAWVGYIHEPGEGWHMPECTPSKPIRTWMMYPYYYFWRDAFQGRQLAPPLPQCQVLFLWGTGKRVMAHDASFLHALDTSPWECAYAGVEGGHWFFIDQHRETVALMKQFFASLKDRAAECPPVWCG